jgi:hypothetical protein
MRTSTKGALIASAVALMFAANSQSIRPGAGYAVERRCSSGQGQMCRRQRLQGKGACKGGGHDCQGKNSCKGKGFIETDTQQQCLDKGGKPETTKM